MSAGPKAAHKAESDGDPENVARAICLRLLTDRPRSRAQLTEALAKRGLPEDAAEAVLDRLTAVGLIDDAAFASAWVSTRQRGRGLARRALREELRRRGIQGEQADAALAQVEDSDELAAARHLVERRLPSLAGLPRQVQLRRLVGLLGRKGYAAGLAQRVASEAVQAPAGADAEPAMRSARRR